MKKIIFISGCKTKSDKEGLAKDLYIGQFTEKAYRYALKIENDAIYFLSTGLYVVEPDEMIRKMNRKFSEMDINEKRNWAGVVLDKFIEKGIDIDKDELIFLTPKDYWLWIVERLHQEGKRTVKIRTPLVGLTQGKQIGWITDRLKELEK